MLAGGVEAARQFSFYGKHSSMSVALALKDFIDRHAPHPSEVWANDPDFDLTILKRWWTRVEKHHSFTLPRWPISYKASRSCSAQSTNTEENSMSKRITITFKKDGTVSMEGHNFKGAECDKFMGELEKSLGVEKSREDKPEMFQQDEAQNRQFQ